MGAELGLAFDALDQAIAKAPERGARAPGKLAARDLFVSAKVQDLLLEG